MDAFFDRMRNAALGRPGRHRLPEERARFVALATGRQRIRVHHHPAPGGDFIETAKSMRAQIARRRSNP